jgi:uncharacterized protein YbaR (Trm112 family)
MSVPKDLIQILACPKCKSVVKEQGMFIVCNKCQLAYPIIENVPDMLMKNAWQLEKAKRIKYKHRLKL